MKFSYNLPYWRWIISMLFFIDGCLTQSQEEIFQFVIDREDICGDPFTDTLFPDAEMCEVECSNTELCKINVESFESKCYTLSEECIYGLRKEFDPDFETTTSEIITIAPTEPTTTSTRSTTTTTTTTRRSTTKSTTPTTLRVTTRKTTTTLVYPDDTTTEPSLEDTTTLEDETTSPGETTTSDDVNETDATTEVTDTSTSSNTRYTADRPFISSTPTPIDPGLYIPRGTGEDKFPRCCIWAARGACDYNAMFMRPACQKSCGTYGCTKENAWNCLGTVFIDHDECIRKNQKFFTHSQLFPGPSQYPIPPSANQYLPPILSGNHLPSYGRPVTPSKVKYLPLHSSGPSKSLYPSTDQSHKKCHDQHTQCSQWASIGECSTNEYWMKTQCQKSCDCCRCTLQSLLGIVYTEGCRDGRKLCPMWASKGECSRNPVFMKKRCLASCGLC